MTATPPRVIPTRRVSFRDSLDSVPRHFAAEGDLVTSHLVAVLSALFPDGEDFFVKSVRHFRHQISDPELARQVTQFIGQESIHSREHRELNHRLAELGYPTKRIERFVRFGLKVRWKVMTAKSNLAATAALEHYTATLAELLLGDETMRDMVHDPVITEIFLWHALEESEHKAVAFDVYKAVGGSERTRRVTMNVITAGFIGGVTLNVIASMLFDRGTWRPGGLRRSLRRLRGNPLFSKQTWRRLRDYNRSDFHPDDRDTAELLERWREELFGAEGRVTSRLVAAG